MFSFCSELLWVSPELIPSTVVPGTPATQKGDVYSFAIILEEIVVRGGPFEAARQFLDPQGDEDLELYPHPYTITLHLACTVFKRGRPFSNI
jgi:hypothetical protein